MKRFKSSPLNLLKLTLRYNILGAFCLVSGSLAHAQQHQNTQDQTSSQNEVESERRNNPANVLDTVTISPTLNDQPVINSLSATSIITQEQIDQIQPSSAADLFRSTPGVHATMNGDDAATSIGIRGMQQFGRVAITLDGARQEFWRVGHGTGTFYVDPELLKQVTVIRGPVSNAYGSGAIGGLVAFETKDAADFLLDNERWALSNKLRYESNGKGWLTSTIGAYKFNEDFDVIGNFVYRDSDEYKDGNGKNVRWTGENVVTGMGKVTFRPSDGHEFKLSYSRQKYDDTITTLSGFSSPVAPRYDAKIYVDNYNGIYTYNPVDNDLWDLKVNAYYSKTENDQYQVWPRPLIGSTRYYDVSTSGVRAYNSSRFTTGNLKQTLTYGFDYYKVISDSDTNNFGSGNQQVYGGLVQWLGEYNEWLEITTALRYDGYKMDGRTVAMPNKPARDISSDGNKLSPRINIGVTPIDGIQFYVSYSEGYRVPHMQNMFPSGLSRGNEFVPNLDLRPEEAGSYEAGLNIQHDGLLSGSDQLRSKINIYTTKVDNYINAVTKNRVVTAENIGSAKLQGIEYEGTYDDWWGYINIAASYNKSVMRDGIWEGRNISDTPRNSFSATLGLRAFEDKLVYGASYQSNGKVTRLFDASAAKVYPRVNLTNLFLNYKINDYARLDFAVDNVFNKTYTDPLSGWAGISDIDQGKGRTFKIAITGRIGGK
ncbi:TonB-dependent receptor [Bartonella sp. HY329]|uniref:TonB-dependent receptor domain-containing protein n=1 Tax=unclassified Bartonella TaxID=2645622 RepID=UPI0021C5A622|nr:MULTISPECIES: TonB-dependent receptor [unclassified Bartonella]UXM94462.1 TonB-dependent receptor [Bartonella sp. HY329]UXN08786.1 TonB-dependent receptor [Bartonella sp. HY328]